jgi:hypothetical protein
MSLESNIFLDITPKEWQDCKYCMIEEQGLQFALKGQTRRGFLEWISRSKNQTYRKRIKDFIKQMEVIGNEKK